MLESGRGEQREQQQRVEPVHERKPRQRSMKMFEQLKREAERVSEAYEKEHANLFRADGSKLFGDEEHSERERALQAERNERLERVEAQARQERVNAEAATKDEVQTLPDQALVERLQAVKDSGDRVRQFCYLHAAHTRLQATQARGEFPLGLSNAVDQLREALGGQSRAQRVEKAKKVEAQAIGVEMLTAALKTGHRTPAAAWEAAEVQKWARAGL
jgi:hypothetical protein